MSSCISLNASEILKPHITVLKTNVTSIHMSLRTRNTSETMANPEANDYEEKDRSDSDNEGEDVEELVEQLEKVDVDPSILTPLSPEVISKQVRYSSSFRQVFCSKRFRPQ